jgi:hypothetical protein
MADYTVEHQAWESAPLSLQDWMGSFLGRSASLVLVGRGGWQHGDKDCSMKSVHPFSFSEHHRLPFNPTEPFPLSSCPVPSPALDSQHWTLGFKEVAESLSMLREAPDSHVAHLVPEILHEQVHS